MRKRIELLEHDEPIDSKKYKVLKDKINEILRELNAELIGGTPDAK